MDWQDSTETQPYEQEFETEGESWCDVDLHFDREEECRYPIDVARFAIGGVKFEARLDICPSGNDEVWADRIPFFDGRKTEHSQYLQLLLYCNLMNQDAKWRCAFTVKAAIDLDDFDAPLRHIEREVTRNVDDSKRMEIPIAFINSHVYHRATVKIKIKLNAWHGFNLPLVHSFERKTDLIDATLIVEGKPIYVNRSILAYVSRYFYNLFVNKSFKDHEKSEFVLPDLPYDGVILFLKFAYPEAMTHYGDRRLSLDELQTLLELAERFDCVSVKTIAEQYIKGERKMDKVLNLSRAMLLADRYNLSSALAAHLKWLDRYGNYAAISSCADFKSMTDATKEVIEKRKFFYEDYFQMSLRWIMLQLEELEEDIYKCPIHVLTEDELDRLREVVPALQAVDLGELWNYGRFNYLHNALSQLFHVHEYVEPSTAEDIRYYARRFLYEVEWRLGEPVATCWTQ